MQGLFFHAMKTQFYILLSLKTPKGFVNYGRYFIGDHRDGTENLFGQLQGTSAAIEHTVLHIDLMETIDELPVKIKTIGCTLD